MDEDAAEGLEPQEIVGEYSDGQDLWYFAKHVDGIAHKVRAPFVSPQPTRFNASFI